MTAFKGLGTYGNAVGVVTPLDHKLADAGLLVPTTTALGIRAGVFYGGNASLVTGTAGMAYSVAAYQCATQRSPAAGVVLGGNDGALSVSTTAAPGSNSRIDIIYHWHREYSLDGVDSNPVIAVVQGTAAAVPTAPSLASFPGAIEIARATVSAGATATNGGGVVITQTSPFTSTDASIVPFRTTTEMNLWTTAITHQLARDLSTGIAYRWSGAAWVAQQGSDDSGWTAATLAGAWVAFGGSHAVPGYRKVGTRVELRGTTKSGAVGTVLTLPAGYRPAFDFYDNLMANGGTVQISVAASTGVVSVLGYISPATNAIVSLHGISFYTD